MSEPFPALETSRLRMRCVAAMDAATTAALMTPEISRWLASWPSPFTEAMAMQRIDLARERALQKAVMPWAVIEKASGALIGWVSFGRDGQNPRRAILGYWLGEAYHGKGYMKEIAKPLLDAAFEWMDVDVIEAAAQPENAGSFKVMQACGMKAVREGMVFATSRNREEWCHFYEIARPTSN